MKQKQQQSPGQIGLAAPEICTCIPFAGSSQEEDNACLVLATEMLHSRVYSALEELLPRVQPVSVLALHIAQLEQVSLSANLPQPYWRKRYHAPAGLLDQVLANVSRVTRGDDLRLLHRESGAVLLFPGVDARGAYGILERVYNSIALLQAETVIPPLALETVFQLGICAYPESATSLEMLLQKVGQVARQFVLRPAITAQQPAVHLTTIQTVPPSTPGSAHTIIPFMELPRVLPRRLTHLIPYNVASRLRCAPVGRHQRNLTVAMSNPLDEASVQRLRELTGLQIFPVSCNEEELSLLLRQGW